MDISIDSDDNIIILNYIYIIIPYTVCMINHVIFYNYDKFEKYI